MITNYNKNFIFLKFEKLKTEVEEKKLSAQKYWEKREFICNLSYNLYQDKETVRRSLELRKDNPFPLLLMKGKCKNLKTAEVLSSKQSLPQILRRFSIKYQKSKRAFANKNTLITFWDYKSAQKTIKFKDLELPNKDYPLIWISIVKKVEYDSK